ncbi:hypothetical protein [Nocardia sp. NPDC050710]|uniref:hypothetical protein n=1 Tax=Nocardia sp. NPDC050710 TaxID=3157220 RepID=UPI0034013132
MPFTVDQWHLGGIADDGHADGAIEQFGLGADPDVDRAFADRRIVGDRGRGGGV